MEKIYVAVEGEGTIAVIDPESSAVIRRIDLSEIREGDRHEFAPHNVQVAPDGRSVWVTANHGGHGEGGGHSFLPIGRVYAHDEEEGVRDEAIVIDPLKDEIVRRIPVGVGVHLAHVVLTPDSRSAILTAQEGDAVVIVDARTYEVQEVIATPEDSEPHGIRVDPRGRAAYVALLTGKALGIVDLRTRQLRTVPLLGAAVQAGVTPDGSLVFLSLYDTKQLAIYDARSGEVAYVDLPGGSKGPIQMYPTPDSRFAYLADQGFYFGEPEGDRVYKIDLREQRVVATIEGGRAPHGVVVSPNGARVYVTNLLSDDVSVIDAAADREVARIAVGDLPNGISVWSSVAGGTP